MYSWSASLRQSCLDHQPVVPAGLAMATSAAWLAWSAPYSVIQPGTFASYWHLVMVAGVISISAGARTIASHPAAEVPLIRTLIILAGPTLFLFGTCLFDWSVTSRLPWARLLAAPAAFAARGRSCPRPMASSC
jgi:hypothetical protein